MAPPRIPPTRFGRSTTQPAGRVAAAGRPVPPAPPPTRFGPGAAAASVQPRHGAVALLRKPAPWLPRRGAAVVQRMELGTTQTGNDKKPCAVCTMGQGLSGRLDELVLYSGGFSSCGPVVMFNAQSRVGGLFHFAAGSLEEQAAALVRMFKDVTPTELHIPRRDELSPGTWDGMLSRDAHRDESDQPPDDGEILEDFFRNQCGFKQTLKTAPSGESYYVTANASGKLIISPGSPPEAMGDRVDYSNTRYPKIPAEAVVGISSLILYGKNMYKS